MGGLRLLCAGRPNRCCYARSEAESRALEAGVERRRSTRIGTWATGDLRVCCRVPSVKRSGGGFVAPPG
ncbi:hypothetical protein QN277_009792 [Acacia crassicarpa]|uniref:Uncharacterized protein n=1 Tax=Acacia crassicarpa TaxID=499986 RepID=A0AAE1INT2_9FABA|nr:hypothetical protein QN277_009792 [Acacia crassicarpa]